MSIHLFSQIVFVICFVSVSYFLTKRVKHIYRNITLGRAWDIKGKRRERLNLLLLVAFGQKKMFKKPLVAFFHFLIYVGFLLINIEVLEIVIDGFLGTHRVFAPFLNNFYGIVITIFEFLGLGVLLSCVIFLCRRDIIKVKRLNQGELRGFPLLDAHIILLAEIILMMAIFIMNATDKILQTRAIDHYSHTGIFFVSSFFIPFFENMSTNVLLYIERISWLVHIIGVFAFTIYITYSKHLHIFISFINTYFSRIEPKGKIHNNALVTKEVVSFLGIPSPLEEMVQTNGKFGAKDVLDLTWKNLMDAYSCTECGRCTSVCPANITGKKLSPRKIMMDTRDRIEEVGILLDNGKNPTDDGKTLLHNFISKEEINACTTCNACTEICPINIDPLHIIVQLRQYVVMEESSAHPSWNSLFANIENNFAPWKFPPTDRFLWKDNA